MVDTTTFGSFPGVRVQTVGNAITGVAIGREQHLVLIGEGDSSNGSASANTVTQINSRIDANRKFGEDTELANACRQALANGANINFVHAIMAEKKSSGTESFSSTSTGQLADAPIVEEDLSASDVSGASNLEFDYASPPTAGDADTVALNPLTGEWQADTSGSYDFDYNYLDWDTALDTADGVIDEGETGIVTALTEAESVASSLSGKINTYRAEYKMAVGLAGAEPNDTDADGNAVIDTATYTDALDNDAMFLAGPVRREAGSSDTILGAVGGLMAGAAVNAPVYNSSFSGITGVEQSLSTSESDQLRNTQVMPVLQRGAVRLNGNVSTSTADDYDRDYFVRRVVDQSTLVAKTIGDSIVGQINDSDTRGTAENQIRAELVGLAERRMIKPNTADAQNHFVDVYNVDSDTVGIDYGVTPLGIVKQVDTTLTIST